MMKPLIKFMSGFAVGTLVASLLIYLAGMVSGSIGNVLEVPDAEQQRNFLMVMASWLLTSTIMGVVATRLKK